MALLTVQDQVSALLRRQLVEDKTRGTPSVQVEAAAVLDSVALNFVFNPRAVLYFSHLARNALLKLVSDELSAADNLKQTIQDLGNQSYALRDLKALERAKTSLLQVETQGQILSTEGAFKGFNDAASEFLTKQLSKNVRKQGSTDLVRPSVEASASLPTDYSALTSLHSEVDSRLKYLTNGVRDFSSSSLSGTLGINTAFRVRRDLESMISDLENDPTAAKSREYAIRLVAARSALRLLGSPPGILDAKVSTKDSLPYGYSLKGFAVPFLYSKTSAPGPWSVPDGTNFTVTVNPASGPPQVVTQPFVLGSRPAMMGTLAGPWYVPPNYGLFFDFGGGNTVRANLNATASPVLMTAADVVQAINWQVSGWVIAMEGWVAGQGRIGIRSQTMNPFSLTDKISEPHPGSTSGVATVWTTSARPLFGLPLSSDLGPKAADVMVDCLNSSLPIVSFHVQDDTVLADLTLWAGETVRLNIPPVFPDDGAHPALSNRMNLVGTYLGEPVQAPLTDLVSAGDSVTSSTGMSLIDSVGITIHLHDSLPVFDGPVVIDSGLVSMWKTLQPALDAFTPVWKQYGGLSRLDSLVSPLYGSPTLARRNDALQALQVLVDVLESLQTVLAGYPLSADVGQEKAVAEGIMATLTERKFDRALSFLLQGRPLEVFSLDWQTASFSGELLAAASEVAKSDVTWPTPSTEERYLPYASDDLSGAL